MMTLKSDGSALQNLEVHLPYLKCSQRCIPRNWRLHGSDANSRKERCPSPTGHRPSPYSTAPAYPISQSWRAVSS